MPEFGFPPQASMARVTATTADIRERAGTVQIEAVTGRHEDPAAALDGQTAELRMIGKALGDAQDRGRMIALAEGRSGAMQTVLGTVLDQVNDLILESTNAIEIGNDPDRAVAGEEAGRALAAVSAALNTRYGERSLFSGDAGDMPALAPPSTVLAEALTVLNAAVDGSVAYADIVAAFDAPGGVYDTALYMGGSGPAAAVEVAPGERVDYAERADDPALRATIRDMAVIALALDPTSGLDDAKRALLADRALEGLRNSVSDIVGVSARLGVAEARIGEARAANIAAETSLTISYNELAGRDQFEAAAELRALETQLETAYLTTARLSSLNLTSFLR